MKKYLKVDEGCRGEIDGVELVETSFELIKEDFDQYIIDLKEEHEVDLRYIEEFAFCHEDEKKGLITVAFGEEDGCAYFDYEMYKKQIDEMLENIEDESLLYNLYEEVIG
jgi:hypothetical protein